MVELSCVRTDCRREDGASTRYGYQKDRNRMGSEDLLEGREGGLFRDEQGLERLLNTTKNEVDEDDLQVPKLPVLKAWL